MYTLIEIVGDISPQILPLEIRYRPSPLNEFKECQKAKLWSKAY
jgi:hypothetical protein